MGHLMFHKVFDGNVHDSKTLQDFIFELEHYDMKNKLLVYDRGISSGRNVTELKFGCDILCGIPIPKKNWTGAILRDLSRNIFWK